MKPINFVDLTIGGGITESEKARCLQSRYYKGTSGHKAETSGVMCAVPCEDICMEDCAGWGGRSDVLGHKMR